MCEAAGITLAVNQNMRYDQSIRACKSLLTRGLLGEPVFASIDMRAIPHWMPWQQRQGWVTLRIMSIHHLDTFRYLLGDPRRVIASVRPDPRTSKQFEHRDGICLYILEYDSQLRAAAWDDVWTGPAREGAEADLGIRWRVEGLEGWPAAPSAGPIIRTVRPAPWTSRPATPWLLVPAALERSLVPGRLCRTDGPIAVRTGGEWHRAGDQRTRQSGDHGAGRRLLPVRRAAPGGRERLTCGGADHNEYWGILNVSPSFIADRCA
jgi:hypothetical protein